MLYWRSLLLALLLGLQIEALSLIRATGSQILASKVFIQVNPFINSKGSFMFRLTLTFSVYQSAYFNFLRMAEK